MISLIVPFYNVEIYARECLNSLINQTYTNLEIICVDDGSTDSTGKICDEYKMIDSRIIVYHKENGGLSDARNYGIDRSSGEFICFVDGDDFIAKDYVENLVNLQKNIIQIFLF